MSNKNILLQRLRKKLNQKYLGLATIIEQLGPSAFKINLLGLGNVYLVFHASLLKPWSRDSAILHPIVELTKSLHSFSNNVYKVEKILERKKNRIGQQEYLIKQKDYPNKENSQELGSFVLGNALKQFQLDQNLLPKRSLIKEGLKRGQGRPPKKKGGELA